MRILVDVFDGAGVARLGEGPIVTATSASVRRNLDAAGAITLEIPASDRRALALLENERQVKIWIGQGDGMRELATGRIRSMKITSAESGARLSISGPDSLGELARKSVLLNRSYDAPVGDVAADLVALAAGWSLTVEGQTGRWAGRFDSITALKALLTVVEQKGLHFRLGLAEKQIEVGLFGAESGVQALGAGAGTYDLASNENVLVIGRLDQETKTQDVFNWLLPVGGGDLATAVTLEKANRVGDYDVRQMTGPDGTLLYYLADDLSIAQYGDELQKTKKYENVKAADTSEAAVINAANTLYDAASADLKRSAFEQVTYRFSAPRPRVTIRPGDRIRVTYKGEIYRDNVPATWIEIDNWFWVLDVTEVVTDAGITVNLGVSTIDKQREDAAYALVKTMEQVEQLRFS